jgi:hypothetical protein
MSENFQVPTFEELRRKLREPELEMVRLIGGFFCELTIAERNEWCEYVQTHVAYHAMHIATENLNRRLISEKEIEEYVKLKLDAEQELFRSAREWYESIVLPKRQVEKGTDS